MIAGRKPARAELDTALADWCVWGGYDAFEAWCQWRDKGTLPFAGGWLEQPAWIRSAFATLNTVYLWHEANEQLANPDDLPPLDSVLNG